MIRHSLAAMAAAVLAIPMTASGVAHAAEVEIEADGPVIELSVYESVTAAPDLVTIGAGVSSEAPTAVEAMRQNAEEMTRVIARIRSLGVADEDIQTTGINLNARYDYNQQSRRQIFRGYQVSNRVSVKLREIDETGSVLDALVASGATDLSGPSFSIENDDAAKDVARQRAVERAQRRAEAYARMVGYDGVRVLAISEAIRASGPVPQVQARALAAEADVSTPVQPGQVSTGVSITIKYEMVDGQAEE